MPTSKSLLSLATGLSAACGGVAIISGVAGLTQIFGYPDIIRQPPSVIMEKLYETRHLVPFLYYFGVGGAGLSTIFFAILFGKMLEAKGDDTWAPIGKICGIISGLLLYVGIIRYSILFPKLAELRHAGEYPPEMIDLVFRTMNIYVGESVAEHAQFLFTALMMTFWGISICKTRLLPLWLAYFAFIIAAVDIIGNFEHFGFSFAFAFNRTGPKMYAFWMLIAGAILIYDSFGRKPVSRLPKMER